MLIFLLNVNLVLFIFMFSHMMRLILAIYVLNIKILLMFGI